jgi:hypothetical protein
MSACDDFCGCGEYSCRECFNDGDGTDSQTGNAWLDEALARSAPEGPTKSHHPSHHAAGEPNGPGQLTDARP